jgi:hypothetical protein
MMCALVRTEAANKIDTLSAEVCTEDGTMGMSLLLLQL